MFTNALLHGPRIAIYLDIFLGNNTYSFLYECNSKSNYYTKTKGSNGCHLNTQQSFKIFPGRFVSRNQFSCRNIPSCLVPRNQLSCQDIYPALCRKINFRAKISTLPCAAKSTFVPDSYPACVAKSTFVPRILPCFVPRNQLSCQNFSQPTPTPTMSFP